MTAELGDFVVWYAPPPHKPHRAMTRLEGRVYAIVDDYRTCHVGPIRRRVIVTWRRMHRIAIWEQEIVAVATTYAELDAAIEELRVTRPEEALIALRRSVALLGLYDRAFERFLNWTP